jgi:hypothetical protein
MEPFVDAAEHLRAELERLDLMLRLHVRRLRAAQQLNDNDFRGLYIADDQVDALLAQPDPPADDDATLLTDQIVELAQRNRERARDSLPLRRLTRLFVLDDMSMDILLIAIAPELDSRYETLYAYAQNDVTKKRPSVDLALKLIAPSLAERMAILHLLSADAPLLRHGLVRLYEDPQDCEAPLAARVLKADDRIVDFAVGRNSVHPKLGRAAHAEPIGSFTSELALPSSFAANLSALDSDCEGLVLFLRGSDGIGRRRFASALCARSGIPLFVVDLRSALGDGESVREIVGLARREAELVDAGLYLARFEALLEDETGGDRRAVTAFSSVVGMRQPVFLASAEHWHPGQLAAEVRFLSFEFPLPDYDERLRLWRARLGDGVSPGDAESIAGKFVLTAGQIRAAASEAHALTLLHSNNGGVTRRDLHSAARAQSSQGLRRLAQKIEAVRSWDDLVVPEKTRHQLHELCTSVSLRHIVHSQWGFDRKLSLGKGLNALFTGPSGTGKTLAAEIIARELGLDAWRVDLASILSKWIGETPKHLRRIFDEAEASNAILFFDEADALFGKRSEVRDAHDKHANVDVAYLLQRVDSYEGIVILATNLDKNLDEAFARRMHHTIEFPQPDAGARQAIWEIVFPDDAPLAEDLDLGFLARQFELTGGNIRNIALAASFMAAEAGTEIGMGQLVLATARELEKEGRLPSRNEFREYYELIRARA